MKTLFILLTVLSFIFGCKSKTNLDFTKNNTIDFVKQDSLLLDSLIKQCKGKYVYAFSAINFIYENEEMKKIIDTLPFGYKLFSNTEYDIESPVYNSYFIQYIKNGNVKKGVISGESVSMGYVKSVEDTSLFFLLGYYSEGLKVKAVKKKVMLVEYALTEDVLAMTLSIYLIDSVEFKNGGEIIIFNDAIFESRVPYISSWYLIFKNNKFTMLTDAFYQVGWADTYLYFPIKTDSTYTMVKWDYEHIDRSVNNKFIEHKLPAEFEKFAGEVVYVERFEDNNILEQKWLRWDGNKVEILKSIKGTGYEGDK